MDKIELLYNEMINYYKGDPRRIQHFVKVHSFARLIGKNEDLDENTQFILEAAALVHDIGIKVAEEKYGYNNGKLQEQEGPAIAKDMLKKFNFMENEIERICYLIAHHHTYSNVNGLDYQILIEADFLVNLYEDSSPESTVKSAFEKIFKTESGRKTCKEMYLL